MNWRRFLRREEGDAALREELESYVDITAAEYIATGMEPEAARLAARRKLGNTTLAREEVYGMNTLPFVESLSAALRYWFRTVRRTPLFAVTAILTLSLGIGATTAIFSVVNGVLIKPLPYPDADDLVSIRHYAPGMGFSDAIGMSPSMLYTYRDESRVFQSIGGWIPAAATVTGLGEPERTRTLKITFGTLQALNVRPLLGRWVSQEDDTPGAPEVVVLGYGYWQRRFGGQDVIGRGITVDSRPRQIIGVMPHSVFRFMGQDPDLFVPLQFDRRRLHLGDLGFFGIARLKPGVGFRAADADVQRMLPIWLRSWPGPSASFPRDVFEKARFAPALTPLKDEAVGNIGNALWLLMGAVGLVLLVACANVANLFLVNWEARGHERRIRLALGAGRQQMLRDGFAESLLFGAAAGLLGLALAYGGICLLRFLEPTNLPRLDEIGIDTHVMLFTIGISLFASLLFGLFPAWKSAGAQHSLVLRVASGSAGGTRERHRARNLLVVGQVSMALVLLVISGLMFRTFQEIRKVQPGFTSPGQVQVFNLAIPNQQVEQPERVVRIFNDILERLGAIPGVSAAGLANSLPMDDTRNQNPVIAENAPYEQQQNPPMRTFKFVSPGFLTATGTRMVAGRDLTWTDIYNHHSLVLVSENLARELWGAPSAALGKRVRDLGDQIHWREVVGVVENVHDDGAQKQAPPTVYWPFATGNYSGQTLNVQRNAAFAVRSNAAGTEAFVKQVRTAVGSIHSTSPLVRVRTLADIYAHSMAQTSFTLVMLAVAGSMALVLGVIGVYAVIAYTVAQRRAEIGIRIALGAQAARIQAMFLRQGLSMTAVGIACGLALARAVSRMMSSLLFGVRPVDPLTYGAMAAVLLTAGVVATYIPARRAAAVDPMDTLRGE